MRTFIHNVAPPATSRQIITATKGGEVSDEAWDELVARVAVLRDKLDQLNRVYTPENVAAQVNAALRPLRAELALIEAERKSAAVDKISYDEFADYSLNAAMGEA